uniref:Uncharacterized protein n=1 Tax=Rhizophora mucronata TaxID=61149 RepID=A0A2P2PD84_RHIMU
MVAMVWLFILRLFDFVLHMHLSLTLSLSHPHMYGLIANIESQPMYYP